MSSSPAAGIPVVYLVDDEDVVRDSAGGLRTRLAELTEREREVMQLVVEGKPNKLIADALDISVRTVEVHRARVFDKMQVKSAVELANVLATLAKICLWILQSLNRS